MKNIIYSGSLLLMCMLSLFFIDPDIVYILVFLCALILCCADFVLENERTYVLMAICYFAAGFFVHAAVCFYPVPCYGLFRRRQYIPAAAGCILFCVCGIWICRFSPLLICLELSLLFTSFLLASETRKNTALKEALKRTKDDSTERDILLTEKNRSLLEKQDYEIYTATLKERNRIAREIHDNVGHLLSRSILLSGAVRTSNRDENLSPMLDSLDATLNSAMDNIRSSVHDLRDEAVNLDETVRSLIKDFTFCPVYYCYDAGRSVPRDVKYSFISITKEALSNIMRHSNARKASVTIREHPALYQLCIEDDGTLDAAGRCAAGQAVGITDGNGGMGISNMRERISILNGTIHISSENGFRILVTIPKTSQEDISVHQKPGTASERRLYDKTDTDR